MRRRLWSGRRGRIAAWRPGPVYSIGRNPESDIVVDEARVSWRHAVLRLEGATWLLEDVGSTNGTFLGAQRVQRVEITEDCVLRLGHPDDGQRLWCSIAAPPAADATAVASPCRDAEPADGRSCRPPPRRGLPGQRPSPSTGCSPAVPRPPPAQPRPTRSHRPQASPAAAAAGSRRTSPPRSRRVAGRAAARRPGGRPTALPARAAGRLEHRPPAQRDHAAADPGAADRARQRQRASSSPTSASPATTPNCAATSRGGYEIVDLGSHNGTYVNGQRVTSAPVTEADIIGIGPATFRLVGAGTAGVHRHRRRLAERAGPDRPICRRQGAARPRQLPARRALPARRHRPERRRQVDPARRADRDAARRRGHRALRQPRPLQALRRAEAPDRAGAAGGHPAHAAVRPPRAALRGRAAVPARHQRQGAQRSGSTRCSASSG